MFLLDQATCADEQLPALMLTTSLSDDESIAVWSAFVMVPEHVTLRTVPEKSAARADAGSAMNTAPSRMGSELVATRRRRPRRPNLFRPSLRRDPPRNSVLLHIDRPPLSDRNPRRKQSVHPTSGTEPRIGGGGCKSRAIHAHVTIG